MGPWSVPRMWEGETVVIVSGGPSLDLAQVHRVFIAHAEKRCRVIAVNDAVFPCWWADWLHAADAKWWHGHKDHGLANWLGIKTTGTPDAMTNRWGVRWFTNTGKEGFDPDPSCYRTGGNGTYAAMHFAGHAGAGKVVLLGADMKGGTHWFGDHPRGIRGTPDFPNWIRRFATLVEPFREMGIEVVNCSPGSALECFPKARLEEVL